MSPVLLYSNIRATWSATLVNIVLVFEPNAEIVIKQAAIIKVSISTRSIAVGPTSDVRKRCILLAMRIIGATTPFFRPATLKKDNADCWKK